MAGAYWFIAGALLCQTLLPAILIFTLRDR